MAMENQVLRLRTISGRYKAHRLHGRPLAGNQLCTGFDHHMHTHGSEHELHATTAVRCPQTHAATNRPLFNISFMHFPGKQQVLHKSRLSALAALSSASNHPEPTRFPELSDAFFFLRGRGHGTTAQRPRPSRRHAQPTSRTRRAGTSSTPLSIRLDTMAQSSAAPKGESARGTLAQVCTVTRGPVAAADDAVRSFGDVRDQGLGMGDPAAALGSADVPVKASRGPTVQKPHDASLGLEPVLLTAPAA